MKLWPPKFRKAVRITVETEQVVVIRRRRITRYWCSQCGDESEFIPVEAVNQVLGGDPGRENGFHRVMDSIFTRSRMGQFWCV